MDGILNWADSKAGFFNFFSKKLSFKGVEAIINCFERNGLDAFGNINCDFALVFTSKNKFYLLRDPFGNTPLFYFIFENRLYYSVDIKSLIDLPQYQKEVNLNEIDYYFNSSNSTSGYNDQTFWKNIYSVIPGQLLAFDETFKRTTENYFKLKKVKNRASNIFLNFKEVFKSAVEKNIDKDDVISSSLSGGIDSSSITSMLQNISDTKIISIELRTSFEIGQEREFAQDVVNRWNTNHFIIDKYPDFFQSERLNCEITGLPSFSLVTAARQIGMIDVLNSQNSNKIFLGEGGDQVLGLQKEYFEELILKSQFVELKYELSNILKYKGDSKKGLHQIPYAKAFLKSTLKDLLDEKNVIKIFQFLWIFYDFKILLGYVIYFTKKIKKNKQNHNSLLQDLILEREKPAKDHSTNHLSFIRDSNLENFEYLRSIFSRESIKLKEQNFLFGKSYGVSFVYPFYDLNILNFISSSDKKINFGDGIGRNIIRQSMKGLLPDSIINRKSKTYFSPFLHQVFWDLQTESANHFSKGHKLWEYINFVTFHEIENIVKNTNYFDQASFGVKNTYLITCLKVYYFGIWLEVYFPTAK